MQAWTMHQIQPITEGASPLLCQTLPDPDPGPGDLVIRISACGVCHTELDEIEGRTPPPVLPMVPGHQVVGTVTAVGERTRVFRHGERVGVGWIYSACGHCELCLSGHDNLCEHFLATGRDRHGGYAEMMRIPEQYAFLIPEQFTDEEAAPLLCAGAIGLRSLRLSGISDGQTAGLTGFGASGHLMLKLIRHRFPGTTVYVFARNEKERRFAVDLGAAWSGDFCESPPGLCHAIIDTTPVWKPVVEALRCLRPGGRLVINAIRKETSDQTELLKLDYPEHLWMEKEIKSVANVSGQDIAEFLEIADQMRIRPEVQVYPFSAANEALVDLKMGRIRGAKVLKIKD
ncbi:zinc-dependent alcohol dehydrogenase family protein [bacterium]|nr:zinc-dependent alcohol dehydrogenase family protein [bacterium]